MPTNTIIAIPPSYTPTQGLETDTIISYLNYLNSRGATKVMTTAGTSQFNLLTVDEIHKLNSVVAHCFEHDKILGIPPLPTLEAVEFVKKAKEYTAGDTHLMALYPDRYYSDELIKQHMNALREHTERPLYLHGMFMRSGYGGMWNYKSNVMAELFEEGCIRGIKEEHQELKKSYDFIRGLPRALDIIVAGGSMRRHQYLHSAGANSFLAGIGNLFPEIEVGYCGAIDNLKPTQAYLDLEAKLFDVFMRNGWHQSLRIALNIMNLTCVRDRQPWPIRKESIVNEIQKVIKEIINEK